MSDKPISLETSLGQVPPGLSALFDRDPLSLSKEDLSQIVLELRRQRGSFQQAEAVARVSGKRVNAKKATKGAPPSGLALDDLDL